MAYRKFKANQLFTGFDILDGNHVLVTTHEGVVQDIVSLGEAGEDIEAFDGLLSPGFVNCHCHLELSHLKGLIPERAGLVDFVFTVVTQRHLPEEEIYDAIKQAEDEMLANGIIAVGDICNNNHTIPQKTKQRLIYYNFIEASGWAPQIAAARFERSKAFYDEYRLMPGVTDSYGSVAMAPHAPYSVSDDLWRLIEPYFSGRTTTIHNQESCAEDEMFQTGTGDFKRMYELMKIDNSTFTPTGKSSLQSYLPKLNDARNVILVHNTFTKEGDIQYAENLTMKSNRFWCLCANANQYIENAMPPVDLLRKYKCNMVIGTDSLASNHQLDVLAEIKTIANHFPSIPLQELLQWGTINGARALQIDNIAGSFAAGKKPGIVLIENLDEGRLTKNSLAKRII